MNAWKRDYGDNRSLAGGRWRQKNKTELAVDKWCVWPKLHLEQQGIRK